MTLTIRPVRPGDAAVWERMRQALWPSEPGTHAREIALFFSGARVNPAEVLLACNDAGNAIGFAEMSIRPYAEACNSGRVAYLEGWFVDEGARRRKVGAALVSAVEQWGRAEGCTELASDTEIDNVSGAEAHRSLGFDEAGRIVCFRKAL